MRKRVQIGLNGLLVGAVGLVVWQVLRVREPTYHGKPLSVWVEEYDKNFLSPDNPTRERAKRAICQIGTNALPILLEWAAAKDSVLKKKVMAFAKKQSLVKIRFRSDEYYHARSDAGFSALGPMAKPAVPALIELLNRGDYAVRVAAAYDLMWIGPEAEEAVPVLVRCLSDSNNLVCFRATRCLAHIHMKPELVVPALVQSLGQARVPERETIAAMIAFGVQAKPAVPNLLRLLEDKNSMIWPYAAHALKQIDPQAAAKAGVE